MDHEEAMISALQNQLPDVHIHLCYFHVGQAIQRWVSQHGLQIYYNEENSTLKVFLGLIRALGLLPINDVMIGYQVILELQLINNINSLTTYLTVNYINNNKIPQWNVHDLNDHRTNNDMEGYHHRLRERFTNRISNFWGFMLFILKETFIMKGILESMRGGDVMPGRRRTYQRNEDRIQQLKANYEQDHDILVFLTNARLCI